MSVYPDGVEVRRTAKFSPCGRYRYALGRDWSTPDLLDPADGPTVTWMMLNPSDANHERDDPTIRRCVSFTRALGASRFVVLNLDAYIATKPAELRRAMRAGVDVVGPDNDVTITHRAIASAESGDPLILAWGANARPERVAQVLALPGMAVAARCLGVTAACQPRHPLMVAGATKLVPYP